MRADRPLDQLDRLLDAQSMPGRNEKWLFASRGGQQGSPNDFGGLRISQRLRRLPGELSAIESSEQQFLGDANRWYSGHHAQQAGDARSPRMGNPAAVDHEHLGQRALRPDRVDQGQQGGQLAERQQGRDVGKSYGAFDELVALQAMRAALEPGVGRHGLVGEIGDVDAGDFVQWAGRFQLNLGGEFELELAELLERAIAAEFPKPPTVELDPVRRAVDAFLLEPPSFFGEIAPPVVAQLAVGADHPMAATFGPMNVVHQHLPDPLAGPPLAECLGQIAIGRDPSAGNLPDQPPKFGGQRRGIGQRGTVNHGLDAWHGGLQDADCEVGKGVRSQKPERPFGCFALLGPAPFSQRGPPGSSRRKAINVAKIQRILVTGGAGFLGSHLCERLVTDGHDVICLDNFFTSQKTNVQHLLGRSNFELVRHDITMPIWLEVDQIYNLACPAAPGHYQYNAIKTIKTSVLGAINVLGMAKRCRAKVLQASTSEVYGDPEVHPQPESYRGNVNPIGPRACYDEGKRAAETLFMDYYRMNRVNVRIIRIFNTYGPRMHPFDGRVISNFIRQALEGEPITIFGDGNQTRSFCYRDDLVEAMIRMMNGPDDFTGPVNIGNPGEYTIAELAQQVIQLSGSRSTLVHRPLPADDPTRRRPDITLAKSKLNWEPTVPLRQGLEKTIEWFRTIDLDDYRPPTPNF